MSGECILVVEDERIVARDIQNRLRRLGYEVPVTLASGEDAVERVAEVRPDLILMDVMLKGEMTGIDAAREIRSREDVPVVYLTAYADHHTLQQARLTEPFGYILKPFEERELHTVVEMALYRHRAEQEKNKLKEQLLQSQKLEAVGHLATGVAHNFNNALSVIIGNTELALMKAGAQVRAHLENVLYAADGAADIVKGLLAFCRRTNLDKRKLDVCALVHEVVGMCRQSFSKEIEVVLTEAVRPLGIVGDWGQLQHAVLNLCLNARDALESVGSGDRLLRLFVAVEEAVAGTRDGDRPVVKISVRDNGIGMDEDTQTHMFEPFFTTKEVGKGTGLGLSTAYGIVQEHEGWIECESRVGEGTVFRVFLPLIQKEAAEAKEAPEPGVPDGSAGTETVLLVDDEEMIRATMGALLESSGYTVLLAADGPEGLALYHRERDRIGMVLLDLSMPGMSGVEVLKRIRAIDPNSRVVVMTGYAAGSLPAARAVLQKPVLANTLMQTVRQVLDAPG